MPLIPLRVAIFRVDFIGGMHHPSLNVFEIVRLLADEGDLFNRDVPSIQQSDRAFSASIAFRVGILGFGMKFIFLKHIAIRFYTSC